MNNQHSQRNDNLHLSLHGTAILPGTSSSRPSSTRSNSQSKQPTTPSREGGARDHKTTLSTSMNISSARQRRHSNSSQRSLGLTSPPPPDTKKSTVASTSSSVFHVVSPREQDADGFFTERSQHKSLDQKSDLNDDEWNETRQWTDELQLNPTLTPPQQQNRDVGPLGMSRDSLNGTVTRTNLFQTNDNQYEHPTPIPESDIYEQITLTDTQKASATLQQWFREDGTKFDEEVKPTPRDTQHQEITNKSYDRPTSAASSTSRNRATPVISSRPPSPRSNRMLTPANSVTSSASTVGSKVTLDDVYETLKKLEQVEQFPVQHPLEVDSIYLNDPTSAAPPRIIDEYPHETDSMNESIRSGKSSSRETPSPVTPRLQTPPPSTRRQQQSKIAQSLAIPYLRSSTSNDRTKPTTPYKSLIVSSTRERDFDHHLQRQKDEYETIIQRHLKFIDQLIEDKKKLSERCERLVSELKIIDQKYNDRIQTLEESHQNEFEKLKNIHESAEKIRREQWIEEKTRKIKELTVRGLEPEIQKLITKHKNELSKMKTVHEAELLAADERASQRYIQKIEELRDELAREKEVAIAKERELARDKYEKSLQDEERSFNEQRRRLFTEIEEEKNRQAELATKQRADIDKLRRDIEENHRTVVESTKREYEAIRFEQERRHANEVQELKERLTLEKQNWEENYMKQQEIILVNKERELREHMKHERDKEIEKIISQFDSDTTTNKEETERTAEDRVKRIRDKYEAELREVENSEKQTKEKYNQIRAQLTEIQGENERNQVLLKQKDAEINDIKKITEILQQERERLSDIIRQEFADRLVLTEEENRRVKGDIAELRARQQLELEKKKEEIYALQQQQEKELETIHEKIKQAISKKDEQVHTLRIQYETVVKRAEHLEGLLSQQRKLISTMPSSGNIASKKTQPS